MSLLQYSDILARAEHYRLRQIYLAKPDLNRPAHEVRVWSATLARLQELPASTPSCEAVLGIPTTVHGILPGRSIRVECVNGLKTASRCLPDST